MTASIRLKLIVPLVGGLALIAVSTAVLMRFVHQRAVDQGAEHEVEQASEALAAHEAQEIDRLTALLEALATDRALADALQRQDKAALLAEARPVFERLRDEHGVTHWYLYGPDVSQGVLLRVHRPDLGGDVVRRPTLRRAVETGQTASGRELGRTAFAVRVVRPWRLDGKLIGYVELGTDLHTFLTRLKRMTDDEYGLLLDKRELEPAAWALVTGHPERWDDRPELVAVASTDGREEIFAGLGRVADIPPRPALLQRLTRDGRTLTRAAFPLRGEGGKVIGAVTVLHDITPLLAGADQIRVRVVIVVVLLAAALAALVIFLLETLVFDRIERMSKSLEELPDRLARGEYHRVELVPRADDEIGRFEAFLDRAIMAIGSFVTDARRVPTGRHPTVRRIDRDES